MADIIVAREQAYTDFDLAFRANPVTGDVALKKNEQAIKQSVLNILLTNRGERPFDPNFGSNITSQLFENFDPIVEAVLDEQIRTALGNYEPRVRVIRVNVDGSPDRNSMTVTVEIEILSPEPVITSVNFSVERLR
jgi:phage baseplate assembly protein W